MCSTVPVWSLHCWEDCSCLVMPTSQPVQRKGGMGARGRLGERGEGSICAAPTKRWLLERWQKHLSSPAFTHSPAVRGPDSSSSFTPSLFLSELSAVCVKLLDASFGNPNNLKNQSRFFYRYDNFPFWPLRWWPLSNSPRQHKYFLTNIAVELMNTLTFLFSD